MFFNKRPPSISPSLARSLPGGRGHRQGGKEGVPGDSVPEEDDAGSTVSCSGNHPPGKLLGILSASRVLGTRGPVAVAHVASVFTSPLTLLLRPIPKL
ncbi:unnamed protein product [Rangifer tarandus platyrhynchus]|uniref:Uncharacterized protein n=1 Tax=Rangifer tarandus platyrhynchus TaxID=3082113 RepID=A0AC59ZVT2_RANTA